MSRCDRPFNSQGRQNMGLSWYRMSKASKNEVKRRRRRRNLAGAKGTDLTAGSTVPTLGAQRLQDLDGAPSWRERSRGSCFPHQQGTPTMAKIQPAAEDRRLYCTAQ